MEVSSQEGEIIPMPLNSTFLSGGHGHGHMIHHDPSPQIPSNGGGPQSMEEEPLVPYNNKKHARYKECLKNHAASMGGNATDGCGEFMPNGEEGTLEALTCSACHCHRNFHRKEVEGEPLPSSCHDLYHSSSHLNRVGRRVILGPESLGYPTRAAAPHHQMVLSYNMGSLPSESDHEQEDGGGNNNMVLARPPQLLKKRFRTKFTQEQKEKMLNFAEKVGWKIQKIEESVVQQFCQEIGVKRRVLKVWMHNNKHNLAKNNPSTST